MSRTLGPDVLAQITSDPNVQAILKDPRYSTPMLRDGAVNNYLANDPRSPVRDAMSMIRADGTPQGQFHFDPQTGQAQFVDTYGHPTAMRNIGLAAIAAASGGAALAAGAGGGAAGGIAPGVITTTAPDAGAAIAPIGASMASKIPWGSVINTGSSLFGNLFGAHMQTSAADRAAQLSAESNRQALQFEREQAENAYLNSEAARRGNYGQWSARERRLGSIAEALGYGKREIPDYVGGVDPRFTGGGGQTPPGGYTPPPALPSYAALTGSDGLTPRPLPSSVGAALESPANPSLPIDPVTGRPIAPGTLRMPSPYQWGPVSAYL